MSNTQQLAEEYRKQINGIFRGFHAQDGLTTISARKAFWKAHRRARNRIYPRGKNFVLKFEGTI